MKSYRIDLTLTAFARTESAISPQRIEDRLMQRLEAIVFDDIHDIDDEVFGYVSNLSVTDNPTGETA